MEWWSENSGPTGNRSVRVRVRNPDGYGGLGLSLHLLQWGASAPPMGERGEKGTKGVLWFGRETLSHGDTMASFGDS